MNYKSIIIALAIIGLAVSLSLSKNSGDDLKAQLDKAISVIHGRMTPEAKAKVSGDLKWVLGNIREVQVGPNELEAVPMKPQETMQQMKEQMDKYGIKFKIPKPEVRQKLLRMINEAERNIAKKAFKQPAYLWYQNNKLYFSGLLIFATDVNAIGIEQRKAEINKLKEYGVLINGEVSNKLNEYSAFIPVDRFAEIVSSDIVKKFKGDRAYLPNLDVSIPEIGADVVWNRAVSPAKGTGVIIGVLDDGIDLNHPDFQIAAGNTRILFLWDQTVTGTPPPPYTYGNECTKAQIDTGICSQTFEPTVGHGTHTIGIAAGDGSAGGGTYTGVAPEADIVYVKINGTIDDFVTVGGTSRLWDGINYIIGKANAEGKPAAISLSYGYQGGPHDGFADTDWLIDQGLNDSSAGRSIAISAGNSGQDNLHSDALICPKGAGDYDYMEVDGPGYPWYIDPYWYFGPDLVYEFYYPADRNINVRVGVPVFLDVSSPYNCNQNPNNTQWYNLIFRFTPEIDNLFTDDSQPNAWGVIYGGQRGVTAGSTWMLCDSPVGDILNENNHYLRYVVYRDSDCRQLNNSHSGTSRCGTTWTPGGCDYHLDNELPPGTDAIYIVFRPATNADVYPRTGTGIRGCGSTTPADTCANDLWHCRPSTSAGPGTGVAPCPANYYPLYIAVQFDEKNSSVADPYGDGGCYSACNTFVSNCTNIAEVPSQMTEVEGWINSWYEGFWFTWTDGSGNPLPEDCTNFIMQGDSNQSIGEPSSAYAAIAAAAYTTKQDTNCNPTDPIGDRPGWSSTGPLRNGTPAEGWAKPEISAPGHTIGSAMPGGVTPDCPITGYPNYQLMSGTSMSAPHIAGAAALLFQCCPTLTLGGVRDLLNSNALDAGSVGYDNLWGWGKLRVGAAYNDLLPQFAGILSANPVSPSQIDLSWGAAIVDECPAGASYDIFRIQGSCPFTPSLSNRIATGVLGTTYSDVGLSPSTTYSYIVRAVTGNNCSEDNVVCLSATTPGGGIPGAIANVLYVSKSGTNLLLQWSLPPTCAPTNTGIYRGDIGSYYSHNSLDCIDDLNDNQEVVPSDTGSYYYLVVARTDVDEGSYGTDSGGIQRPRGGTYCVPNQNTGPC